MIIQNQKFSGFTLLEVLVTMVVLAIGLLGLASLQGIALKSSASIQLYSQANNLAYSILDAMRVNNARAIAGDYNIDFTTTPTICINNYDITTAGSTIAQQDIADWINNLACTLPNGIGVIQVNTDADGNTIAVITVQWDNRREQSDQSAVQIQVISGL